MAVTVGGKAVADYSRPIRMMSNYRLVCIVLLVCSGIHSPDAAWKITATGPDTGSSTGTGV